MSAHQSWRRKPLQAPGFSRGAVDTARSRFGLHSQAGTATTCGHVFCRLGLCYDSGFQSHRALNRDSLDCCCQLYRCFEHHFVSTVGGAPLAVIKQYVENQKNV